MTKISQNSIFLQPKFYNFQITFINSYLPRALPNFQYMLTNLTHFCQIFKTCSLILLIFAKFSISQNWKRNLLSSTTHSYQAVNLVTLVIWHIRRIIKNPWLPWDKWKHFHLPYLQLVIGTFLLNIYFLKKMRLSSVIHSDYFFDKICTKVSRFWGMFFWNCHT
jgi:hypothetical protein